MFSIEMLPANEGDALWIEYGSDPVRRILIDCGRKTAYRAVADRLGGDADITFELFVLTHVDADHIAGAIPLFQDGRFGPQRVKDIWFNGWRHLNGLDLDFEGDIPETLSAGQGEYFGAVIRDRDYPWNSKFGGSAVVVEDDGKLPVTELEGGMKLTLLGPMWDKLEDMRKRWERDLSGGNLEPGDYDTALDILGEEPQYGPDVLGHDFDPDFIVEDVLEVEFDPDTSEPNGSSITFLAEFDGKAVLFAGDAHAPQLVSSIQRLLAERGLDVLSVDAFKLAHHGSARNNSTELLSLVNSPRYLLSTNGSRHHHPDPAALARALDLYTNIEFHFNYCSEETKPWARRGLQEKFGYKAIYPETGDGLKVEI